MSKVAIQGNASGTGTFTIAAPNSNTDRTLTLPDEAGTVLTSASDIESQVKTATNATGTAPIYACRAWVTFNGTGTVAIRASGNVSSITDNGTGDYSVNFVTAMPDTNYCVVMASGANNYNEVFNKTNDSNFTTSLARVIHLERETVVDSTYMHFALFR